MAPVTDKQNNQKSNQQEHDNKMAAAVKNSGAVLLRRPLPPLPTKEDNVNARKNQVKNRRNDIGVKRDTIHVLNSLQRHTTLQRTTDVLREQEKMKEYQRRIAIMLANERKPRGRDPLPMKIPKKASEIDFNAFLDDSYEPPPPIFRLNDFLTSKESLGVETGSDKTVHSRIVEKPLERWHVYENRYGCIKRDEKDFSCQNIVVDEQVDLPEVKQRIPFRQHIIEEKALLLESYSAEINEKLQNSRLQKSKVPAKLSIARPTFLNKDKLLYADEDIISEADSKRSLNQVVQKDNSEDYVQGIDGGRKSANIELRSSASSRLSKHLVSDDKAGNETGNFEVESVVFNSPPMFFQGELCARSPSPFDLDENQALGPVELALLQCIRHGGTKLILKAHFIDQLPDISQLSSSLIHINLSFNNFESIPEVLFEAPNLEVLKLRNNPIFVIPRGILELKKLKNLTLSFCRISSLPQSLFQLSTLEKLDLSYNEVTFIPDELRNLRSLKVLNVEGNRLTSLPSGILFLPLRTLNVGNNFLHPVFWEFAASLQPQPLVEMCATVLAQQQQHLHIETQDEKLMNLLASVSTCGHCDGPKFGQGLPLIKPIVERFGVKNLPILFYVCSQTCHNKLKSSTELALSTDFA